MSILNSKFFSHNINLVFWQPTKKSTILHFIGKNQLVSILKHFGIRKNFSLIFFTFFFNMVAIYNWLCYTLSMKIYGDYHTHTYFSDGVSSVEQNVKVAIDKGLKEIAITDHSFGSPSIYSLTRPKFARLRKDIATAKEKYGDQITIYTGIEADIIGIDGQLDLKRSELELLDVLVMGYHSFAMPKSFYDFSKLFWNAHMRLLKFPSQEDIARNTKAIINSIKKYPIDILAHPNHILKVDCYELAKAASDYGVYLELNAKHINTLSPDAFAKMLTTDVKFLMNSDAHKCGRVAEFAKPLAYAEKYNMDLSRIVNLHELPTFKKKS